jgi:protocatechuate 3,4-dioxygenase beta subunit
MRAALLLVALAVRAATLDGTVTSAATGEPVRKARVTARGSAATYTAVSDSTGRWSIPAILPGEYEVTVERQGHLPPAAKRRLVQVPEDGAVAFELLPLGAIAGKVVDEEGDPLPNVAVHALAYDYTRPAPTLRSLAKASTDDRGEFRLFDLRPGRYYVQAVASDRARAILYHAGASDVAQASPVDLAPGAEAGGIDFRLGKPALFRITGRVVEAYTGQPLRAVIVAEAGGASGWRYSAQCDGDGAFSIAGVRPGAYHLSVTQNSGPRVMWAEQPVLVSGRDVEGVQLAAAPSAEISGAVVVEGPRPAKPLNLRVTLDPAERFGFSETALPKPDGTFTITAGPLLFAIQVLGIPPELYLRDIRFGAQDASAGRLDLRRGPAPLNLVLASNPGRIAGTVETAAGKPAPGVLVAITPADPAIRRHDLTRTIYTDADGHFEAYSLAPGDYKVFAWERFDPSPIGSLEFRRLLGGSATPVSVQAGAEASVRLRPVAEADIQEARRRLP